MTDISEYTAQILVSRREPVEVMGHELYFKEMELGPLHDDLEERVALGWSAEALAVWLTGALDDPEIGVVVEIQEGFEGWMVTACVGRATATV